VGLSRSPNVAKIKDVLQPAIEELERIGFLEPIDRKERYTKIAPGQWKITLVQRPPKAEEGRGPDAGSTTRSERGEHEAALIARGVTPVVAARLVEKHARERIAAKLETFDWLIQKKDKRVQKNPAGYLVKSIEDDYAPPKGFESKAERAKRLQAEVEQERRAEEARRSAESEGRAREEAQQARIAAYWASLTPADQEALKTRALAGPSPFLNLYRQHQGRGTPEERLYRKLIIEAQIVALLGDPRTEVGPG